VAPLRGPACPLRVLLAGELEPAAGCLLARGDRRAFALVGQWAESTAVVGSEPVAVGGPDEDPFELLDWAPELVTDGSLEGLSEPLARSGRLHEDFIGGGWFGFLGYRLGALIEPVPPPPRRPVALPGFALAFYDHVARRDRAGRWWFEALWTEDRDATLRHRLEELRARLIEPPSPDPCSTGTFRAARPGASGHVAAVRECRERIAAGEVFQANLCLRLDGALTGSPLDLFASAAAELSPRYGALVTGPWGAVLSFSPELFLRRRDRSVTSEPIKGTAPRPLRGAKSQREALAASSKDRAENVMIVDLMRNDLGRVCEYGSVRVDALAEPRPAPGVWHLVSTVSGTLRPDVHDSDLLRASFPPGSVIGAPKVQAMRVISELEATAREAYTGAIGYSSPAAGLELNVAIRTLEASGGRVWLGAGGGIVADSSPEGELRECMLKARPIIDAARGRLAEEPPSPPSRRVPAALTGAADRPDPSFGVFETILVREAVAIDAVLHLARLERSLRELYGQALPPNLPERVEASAAEAAWQRLRVLAAPGSDGVAAIDVAGEVLDSEPGPEPVTLARVSLPGGLGAHKWRDRRLLEALARTYRAVPLIVDLDGDVLEAAHANVWIAEGNALITPPLDGRILAGTVRARLIDAAGRRAREERIDLARLAAADEILLSSSIRGVQPAFLAGLARAEGTAGFAAATRLHALLDERKAVRS
jgi:para-aminobenzoate synthetase / 4-amino-4-deoxychorismate lyase